MTDIRFKLSTSNTSLDFLTFSSFDEDEDCKIVGMKTKRSLSICSLQDLTTIKKCKHSEEKKNKAHFLASMAIQKFKQLSAVPTKLHKRGESKSCRYLGFRSPSLTASAYSAPNSPSLSLRRYKHSKSLEDVPRSGGGSQVSLLR